MRSSPRWAGEARTREAWDRYADLVVRWSGELPPYHYATRPMFSQLMHLLEPVRGARVLDAGCGEGSLSRMLARAGAHVTGVDLSPRQLALATQYERYVPLGIDYRQLSVTDLDGLPDDSFDAVLSNQVLPSIENYGRAMAEMARVLRPDGRVVVAIPHPWFLQPGVCCAGPSGARHVSGPPYGKDVTIRYQASPQLGLSLETHHRPLGHYLAVAFAAGLVLDACQEWPGVSGPATPEASPQGHLPVPPLMLLLRFRPGVDAGKGLNRSGAETAHERLHLSRRLQSEVLS